MENGIAHSRGQSDNRRFTCAHRWHVFSVNNLDFDNRNVTEAGNSILSEMRIQNASILKVDVLKHCATNALDDGSSNLVPQAFGIDHSAAIKCFHNPFNSY